MARMSAGRPSSRSSTTQINLTDVSITEKPKRISVEIAPEKHTALKVYAASQGKTITQVITQYIDTLID